MKNVSKEQKSKIESFLTKTDDRTDVRFVQAERQVDDFDQTVDDLATLVNDKLEDSVAHSKRTLEMMRHNAIAEINKLQAEVAKLQKKAAAKRKKQKKK